MISPELKELAHTVDLDDASNVRLRLRFGIACITRVEHLLTDSLVIEKLSVGRAYLAGESTDIDLQYAAKSAMALARSHPGSGSIDGAASAAVTTSFGVAAALACNALEAAGYAAYASVYAYAGYAVTDISAYKTEHDWQVRQLRALSEQMK